MSKFLHGPPKFSCGPPVGDRCYVAPSVLFLLLCHSSSTNLDRRQDRGLYKSTVSSTLQDKVLLVLV
jgi:hypothetical protein